MLSPYYAFKVKEKCLVHALSAWLDAIFLVTFWRKGKVHAAHMLHIVILSFVFDLVKSTPFGLL